MKILETERLALRPWDEGDAESLYEYANDPRVGPMAGWPAHTDVGNSLDIIRTVLSAENTFAVTVKGDGRAVGSIGLIKPRAPGMAEGLEIGYWIGVPFWGRGYIPEAVREMLRYGFENLKKPVMWCGHYEGNEKSRRVIEKCGFKYRFSLESYVELMGETRTEYFYALTGEEWRA